MRRALLYFPTDARCHSHMCTRRRRACVQLSSLTLTLSRSSICVVESFLPRVLGKGGSGRIAACQDGQAAPQISSASLYCVRAAE